MAEIIVGMADLRVCRSPDTLLTLGLGSCVGVCLYDRISHIAGMAHVMLPSSIGFANTNRAKFADCAIGDLLNEMLCLGACRATIVAKLAGGAHMFAGSTNNILKVGERNAQACIQELSALRIPILSSDTGGTHGRTIQLSAETGMLRIRTVGLGEKTI